MSEGHKIHLNILVACFRLSFSIEIPWILVIRSKELTRGPFMCHNPFLHIIIEPCSPYVGFPARNRNMQNTWDDSCRHYDGWQCPFHRGCLPTVCRQLCCVQSSLLFAMCIGFLSLGRGDVLCLQNNSNMYQYTCLVQRERTTTAN